MGEENNETMEVALLKGIHSSLGDIQIALAGITGLLKVLCENTGAIASNTNISLDESRAERLGNILAHDPKRVAEVIAQNDAELRSAQAAASR